MSFMNYCYCREVEDQFRQLHQSALVLRDVSAQINCFGIGKYSTWIMDIFRSRIVGITAMGGFIRNIIEFED